MLRKVVSTSFKTSLANVVPLSGAFKQDMTDLLNELLASRTFSGKYFGVYFEEKEAFRVPYATGCFGGTFSEFETFIDQDVTFNLSFWRQLRTLIQESLAEMPDDTQFRVSIQVSQGYEDREDALGLHRDSFPDDTLGLVYPRNVMIMATSGTLRYVHFPYRADRLSFNSRHKPPGVDQDAYVIRSERSIPWDVTHNYADGGLMFDNVRGLHDALFSNAEPRLAIVVQFGEVSSTSLPVPKKVHLGPYDVCRLKRSKRSIGYPLQLTV